MMNVIKQTTKLVDELDELITVNGGFPLHGSTNFSYDDKLPEVKKHYFEFLPMPRHCSPLTWMRKSARF